MARTPQRPPARAAARTAPARAAAPAPQARPPRVAPAQPAPEPRQPRAAAPAAARAPAPARAAPAQPHNRAVATTDQTATQVPAFLADYINEDAGKGTSTAQADNLVPMIMVLQPLSPECLETSDKFIEHARPGDIMLKGLVDPIIQGNEGVLFQPCAFFKKIVEWIPRQQGGGFVAQHDFTDDWVERLRLQRVPDPQNPNRVRFMKNNHEFIETRYHAGAAYLDNQRIPYVIPFTSTGHTVSRDWMFKMNQTVTQSGEKPPTFAKLYSLRTKSKTNAQGTWYLLDISDAGYVQSVEDYEFGRTIYQAFESGALVADAAQAETGDHEGMAGQGDDNTM